MRSIGKYKVLFIIQMGIFMIFFLLTRYFWLVPTINKLANIVNNKSNIKEKTLNKPIIFSNSYNHFVPFNDFVGHTIARIYGELGFSALNKDYRLNKKIYEQSLKKTKLNRDRLKLFEEYWKDYYELSLYEENVLKPTNLINWNDLFFQLWNKLNILRNDGVYDFQKKTKNKTILLYSTIFNEVPSYCENWKNTENCLFNNCPITCDKNNTNDAAAIILHDLVDKKNHQIMHTELADKIREDQRLIFWSDETSLAGTDVYKMATKFGKEVRPFNWSMGFSRYSEITLSYGLYNLRKSEVPSNEYMSKIETEFFTRKNGALWFVSNCNSKKRWDFAKKLQEFFPVEIFGKCVEKSCDDNCRIKLSKNYKFYLSLENSDCADYITEKFYRNALSVGLIPIVLQPNLESYEQIAPKDSFIHFSHLNGNVEALGKYLRKISQSFQLYYEYRKWEKTYEVIYPPMPHRLCQLCTRLNIDNTYRYYNDHEIFHDQMCSL
ncbi:hypothetical protein SNEBB_010020 [Seison nebaliae]|nr:hypothetical protein SNEBB_010020 [Seison nebaliae]